jgi:predicted acylesterase/phospholipase RssA
MLDGFVSGLKLFSDALAERTGRGSDDIPVRTLAGAIIGVGLAAMLTGDGPEEFFERFDAHLAELEAGLEL